MSLKRKFMPRREREAKTKLKRIVNELSAQPSDKDLSPYIAPMEAPIRQCGREPQGQPLGAQKTDSGSGYPERYFDQQNYKREGPTQLVQPAPPDEFIPAQSADRGGGEIPSWRQESGDLDSVFVPSQGSSTASYPSIYEKPRSQLSERDYRIISRDYDLTGAPNPLRTWSDATITIKSTFKAPTAIQAGAIPLLLEGMDVVGVAPTGSGKTLAFVLPASKQTLTLVLSPTRELAIQTTRVFEANEIPACALVGGHSAEKQREQLAHAKAIVATPGRLVDFMENEGLDLNGVTLLVLDEADRMLDMGFEDALVRVKEALGRVQTAMFTATWDETVEAVALRLLNSPFTLRVGTTLNARISQSFEWTTAETKRSAALEALKRLPAPCLVFCNTKAACEALGLPAVHSGRPQKEREQTLQQFAKRELTAICATDVVGRGIDIAVRSVLNYDMPLAVETFVHRVGRTGRGGNTGVAHTLLEDADKPSLIKLKKLIRHAGVSAAGLEKVMDQIRD